MIDPNEFKNKKIIITGSSTGIGFETAIELGSVPMLFFMAINLWMILNKEKDRTFKNTYSIFRADFTQLSEVEKFMENSIKQLNGLDILINNAGTMIGRFPIINGRKKFLKIFDLNSKSAFLQQNFIEVLKNKMKDV